jgi:hypothetical protein
MTTDKLCPHDYIDITLNDRTDEQPIRLMAKDCNELFAECLARSSAIHRQPLSLQLLRTIKEYYHRFDGWCTFLGVFAVENAALDYRLRRHVSLQDMLIRMIDMLRQNLFLSKKAYTPNRQRS